MPELPDLEVFSHNLTKRIGGKKLTSITIATKAKIKPSAKALTTALTGSTLKEVKREGKQLYFLFSGNKVAALHLMLHGKLQWVIDEPVKHQLVEFAFGKIRLALTDFQRSANITLNPDVTDVPDAMSKEITAKVFQQILQTRGTVKNLLLNQKVIRGIGNAYADEILWAARVHPLSVASAIPAPTARKLHSAVRKVLQDAMKKIKKVSPEIIGGEERGFLLIHNSKKEKSPGGKVIQKATAGGRKTYYTDEQQLYK